MPPERLRLDLDSSQVANRATAAVLLLYYQLLREGGITNDQTIYVNAEDFDPFKYLTVEVSDELSDVDQALLREGAFIHLLCDLNDMVGEYESDYLKQPLVKQILAALSSTPNTPVPEGANIVRMVTAGESALDFQHLAVCLADIYKRYVVARFRALVASEA
jgi:hypothetical protein